jgi:hypothetical protein
MIPDAKGRRASTISNFLGYLLKKLGYLEGKITSKGNRSYS